jgi:vanillate O-demethylase monooxygenase subunit
LNEKPNEKPVVQGGFSEFPLDAWYVAAFSREVTGTALLARRICGVPMVFFRTPEGAPAALFDRCPHRGLPLSVARLRPQGTVQCGYHGFEFDAAGRCTRIPAQDGVPPPQMSVRTFPVVERWQWLWVWPGDPAKADPALIPDHDALGLQRPGWGAGAGIVLHAKANFLLLVENLVDATHIAYLHSNPAFGADQHMDDEASATQADFDWHERGDVIRITRAFNDEEGHQRGISAVASLGRRDRNLLLETHGVQTCVIGSQWRPASSDEAYKETKLVVSVTPETATSSWKFTAGAANTQERLFDDSPEALHALFAQDITAVEMIQSLCNELGAAACPEVSQKADAAGIRLRRKITERIATERAAQGTRP